VLVKDFDQIKRRTGPPASYSREKFAQALAPLWKRFNFRYDCHEDVVRAGRICTRLYEYLGRVLRLEDVYDIAEYLANQLEEGQEFPGAVDFLPEHRHDAVTAYLRRGRSTTRDELRKMGY
jgi:hypothetical protein